MEDNKEAEGFRLDTYYEGRNDTDLASLDAELAQYDPDNEFAGGGEMNQAEQFQAANKKPDPAMMALQGAASGAAAGAAFGPWGAAIGGVVGGAAGFMKGKAGAKKFEMMLDTAETGDNNAANMKNGPASGASSVIGGSQVGIMNAYEGGGEIGIPNSLVDGAPNVFNNGGTHEESPLGGIPQGKGSNGKQNLVEEDEVSFMYNGKKLIISNRM